MDLFIRAVNMLARIAGVTAALLIGLAVLVICDMVIERYILNLTTIWQIDVVTYSVVAATFVGSAYVLMTRGHVNVEILAAVSPSARPLLAGAGRPGCWRCPSASCCSFSARSSGTRPGASNWRSNTVWRARLWIPYLAMPVGLGLLVLQYIADLLALVTGRALPFGLSPKENVEEFGREQAKQVLGDAP